MNEHFLNVRQLQVLAIHACRRTTGSPAATDVLSVGSSASFFDPTTLKYNINVYTLIDGDESEEVDDELTTIVMSIMEQSTVNTPLDSSYTVVVHKRHRQNLRQE